MSEPINLANYKEDLTRYRSYPNRYWCPVCDGHNLTFSPIGQWMCWNDPTRAHRIEIMAALVPNFKQFTQRVKSEPCPVIIPPIHFAQLHFPFMKDDQLAEVTGKRTVYRYSETQRVVRIDYRTDKVIFPQFYSGQKWLNGAGSNPWRPYGLSRLLPYPGQINLILVVEGQKCVEIAHSRGIPALCLQGGDYSTQTTFDKLRIIKNTFKRLLLVVLPDYDLAGNCKAQRIIHTARYFNLPTLLLDPLQIEPDLPVGGDIEQMPDLDADRLLAVVRQQLRPP
jgi:putative DNA primase/helicase